MNSHRQTKQALLTSVMALVMCVFMLLGTTFAWFTDTATTSVNTIKSGNLDVQMQVQNDRGEWIDAKEIPLTWVKNAAGNGQKLLWEPGASYDLTTFRIANIGSLNLKYKVIISGATGDTMLLDVIDFSGKIEDEAGNVTDLSSVSMNSTTPVILDRALAAGKADTITLNGTMQTSANNTYMNKTVDDITIAVYATQATGEYDSTRNDYDKFAEYPEVTTVQIPAGEAATVNDAVKNAITAAKTVDSTTGKTTPTQIVLPANTTVTLESGVATPAQGQTSNIKITGDKTTKIEFQNSTGGSDGSGTTYQDGANLTFQGVTISGGTEQFVARGGVVTFIDCTINGEIKKTTADKFVFSGCSFTAPVSQANYGCKDIVFDGCKFDTVDGYGIKIYSEGYEKAKTNNLTVKNCEFKNSANAAKAAIFLDHIIDGLTYNITVENCTFDGFTAEPTANNKRGNREIITSSFIKSGEQYVFAYQTGNAAPYQHTLDASQLVVTVK